MFEGWPPADALVRLIRQSSAVLPVVSVPAEPHETSSFPCPWRDRQTNTPTALGPAVVEYRAPPDTIPSKQTPIIAIKRIEADCVADRAGRPDHDRTTGKDLD